jgi:MOSC domain-containing protein YiiM
MRVNSCHRFLANKDPTQPNLRQVLVVDTSIHADLSAQGISLKPGMLGEKVLVDGIKVMALALEHGSNWRGAVGTDEVRNPCYQLNEMHPDLLKAVATKVDGQVCRNAGMMARILRGGWVRPETLPRAFQFGKTNSRLRTRS